VDWNKGKIALSDIYPVWTMSVRRRCNVGANGPTYDSNEWA
jgi:hypothetical protein